MCKISRNILKRAFQRDILCCRRASESRKGILYEALERRTFLLSLWTTENVWMKYQLHADATGFLPGNK